MKILIVFGTRPEAIKMAPVIRAFMERADRYETKVCVTGQHREMLDQVLDFFEIIPDFDLNLMKNGQTLNQLTADVITKLYPILENFKADYLFVHGDTTTSAFAALAGYYAGIKVCHVEAGLRTHNIESPFPEEANRQLTARLASIHFAPTPIARINLLNEGIDPNRIFITGNTVIDALLFAKNKVDSIQNTQIDALKKLLHTDLPIILVTCHRRENFGKGLDRICNALKIISDTNNVQIVYPVHLNPNIHEFVFAKIGKAHNIHLIEPLDYPAFIWLMKIASFIITDSGGVQEEGTALGKSILLMRENTERPEVVHSGHVKLVGTDEEAIVAAAAKLLKDGSESPLTLLSECSSYGSGEASKEIMSVMQQFYV